MRLSTGTIAAAGLLLFAAQASAAANVTTEVTKAASHAGLAEQSADLKGVHMHLHHTLNCLVGPKGDGFDAKQLNPCSADGDGAIADTADAAQKKNLEAAADKARSGIAQEDLAAAKKDAGETQTMLKAAH
jgi:hypothetical protein